MTRNFYFLPKKNFMNETSTSPGHVQIDFWQCLHINHCGISELLYCQSIKFHRYEDSSQNKEETSDDPSYEQQIHMEYSSD
jgi:hypothetical protein